MFKTHYVYDFFDIPLPTQRESISKLASRYPRCGVSPHLVESYPRSPEIDTDELQSRNETVEVSARARLCSSIVEPCTSTKWTSKF
jgi:hypothetical protein